MYNASGQVVGTIASVTGTTAVLSANAAVAVASGAVLSARGTGVGGENTSGAGSFSTADGIYRYLNAGVAGATALTQGLGTPHSLGTALSYGPTLIGTAKVSDITSNGVAALTNVVAADQTDNVSVTAGAVKVRPGTAAVTYTATAKDNAVPAVAVAGATVTFKLTAGSGIALTDLTANGAAVPTSGEVNVTTGTDGTAKLVVSSAKTADTNSYSVDATSGVQTATPQLVTTYATAAVDAVKITSSSADLTPVVGTASVTVKGKLVDQYGKDFQPPSSDSQQVVVSGAATGNVVPTAGAFTYTYTPATAPAAGSNQTLTFTYGAKSANASINWASAAAAAKVTLTAPADKATGLALQTSAAPSGGIAVTGSVLDASNAGLAYKGVTLSGGDGVWFATAATPDADHPLKASLDTVATSSGALQNAYVFFTKGGDHKVTATAGTATASSTVTVNNPAATSGWTVSVSDVSGAPGSTLIVTGKVVDVFGGGVPGATVSLSPDPSTVGTFGSTALTTNSSGVFSTTFVSGSNSSGDVKVTAEITNNGATLTPAAAWKTAGVDTLKDGVDKIVGMIKIAATKLTISATAKLTAGAKGGTAKLSGTYLPNTSVDIYARESGDKAYGLSDTVETDAEGEWGTSLMVDKSTRFIARSSGLSSPSVETQVWSTVSLTAKALGKGRVELTANGDPNAAGTLAFYRSIAGADPVLKKLATTNGSGRVTVSLPKGARSVYVTYKATGTGQGQSKVVKVNVK